MTKIIGIKDLQTKTKQIREEVEKGVTFVVVWRSKPIFEIRPFDDMKFADDFEKSGLYNTDFIERMREAEKDIGSGRTKSHKSPQDFLKSLQ